MRQSLQIVFAGLVLSLSGTAAFASPVAYTAMPSGAAEAPPNASPGTGQAFVEVDAVTREMRVLVTFSGLTGNVTASHIHCCTAAPGTGIAGVATTTPTFTDFPLGATFGSYDHTFDMTLASSYNAPFVAANGGTVAGAFAALLAGLAAGESYFNIHTSVVPGGEIRGFLVAGQIPTLPEPQTAALLAMGVFTVLAFRRRPG